MLNSVRGCICTREVGGSRQLYELSVMTQVSSGLARNQVLVAVLALVLIAVVAG